MATLVAGLFSCAAPQLREGFGPDPNEPMLLTVVPQSATIPTGQNLTLRAYGRNAAGDSIPVATSWSASGGTISAGGLFSPAGAGTYVVRGTAASNSRLADSSVVTVVNPPPTPVALRVSPGTASVQPGATQGFLATLDYSDGSSGPASATWTAGGGTITPAGVYTAGAAAGTFDVIALEQSGKLADTASVTISPTAPTVTAIVVSPATASVPAGGSQQFSATGRLSDGSSAPATVIWTASGGTITSGGRFTAGTTTGSFRVIGTQQGGTLADTSEVTVTAPVLTQVMLTPATVGLLTGATQQFSVSGRMSDGSSTAVTVNYAATGGTITAAGLYTAGSTAGTFRVIATLQGGGLADTSTITITVPVLTQVVLVPATVSVAAGAAQQFTASGRLSDGSSVPVTVNYTATGGTITAGGLYTAGATGGSFRVVATQQGGTLADTSAVTITAAAPTLVRVVLSPASATLVTGGTQQLSAVGRMSDSTNVTILVSYAATGGTISSAGLYTAGGGTGAFSVIATQQGGTLADTSGITIVAPPPPGATPDPTLLPVATTLQSPLTAAYNALNVPGMPAGGTYRDPTTGVTVYKLTSAIFPTPSANWGHDYSEGGDEISLPYNGNTRAVLVRQNGGGYWLMDFTPGVGVGNARSLTGNLDPQMDVAFSFSNNPATPYYAYVISNGAVRRFDLRVMAEAPGNGWPKTDAGATYWLQQSKNDEMFVWWRSGTSTMVAYDPATGTTKTYTNTSANEPRIDREGRFVGLSMDTPANGLRVWDWNTGTVTWSTTGDPGIPFAHNASLRRQWMVVDWNLSFPDQFARFVPDVPNSGTHIGGPAVSTTVHGNGNWIQYPADLNDQWALFTHYGSLAPSGAAWLAPGGMVLITANGERRLLAHPYQSTSNYTYFAFPKMSSDGRYAMFTSNMNGSSRNDLFLAELPVR